MTIQARALAGISGGEGCLQKPLGGLSPLWNGLRVCLGQEYNVVFKVTDGFQAYEKLNS